MFNDTVSRYANSQIYFVLKKKLFVFDIDDKYRARLFWTIVGSLMGGSALLAVCVFLCFRYVCGWKPSLGKGSNPTQGYSGQYPNLFFYFSFAFLIHVSNV